ncbi:DUF3964 family protein [Bacillus sp. BP-3]|uniref:DUF3964 family protein n=1 Tax=Bacillus sp. BP-3 TaxID=3022773 RepID=UPI00232AAD70|nr:DUF3964 family protein [Bacillus sp. BP-3]MDC2865763.1 DUF3964 family protein [Bacillus sp. BP-3]
MTREQRILLLPFFKDKRGLAEQIMNIEQQEHQYLPNQFEIKQVPPYTFGDKQVVIGRIHEFYFIGIYKDNGWKYQAFTDVIKCRSFFIGLSGITDQQLAFWFNNIELLAVS